MFQPFDHKVDLTAYILRGIRCRIVLYGDAQCFKLGDGLFAVFMLCLKRIAVKIRSIIMDLFKLGYERLIKRFAVRRDERINIFSLLISCSEAARMVSFSLYVCTDGERKTVFANALSYSCSWIIRLPHENRFVPFAPTS